MMRWKASASAIQARDDASGINADVSVDNSIRQKKHVVSKEFTSRPAVKNHGSSSFERFSAGERVFHATFGYGTILSANDVASDVLYEIAFDDTGVRKIMATFARLKKA